MKEWDQLAPSIAIVGSRDYGNLEAVRRAAYYFASEGIRVVSGGARGVDQEAERAAFKVHPSFKFSIPPKPLPGELFRSAAFRRNKEIVNASTGVLAFWTIDSTGTANTVTYAVSLGRPTFVWTKTENLSDSHLKQILRDLWSTYM